MSVKGAPGSKADHIFELSQLPVGNTEHSWEISTDVYVGHLFTIIVYNIKSGSSEQTMGRAGYAQNRKVFKFYRGFCTSPQPLLILPQWYTYLCTNSLTRFQFYAHQLSEFLIRSELKPCIACQPPLINHARLLWFMVCYLTAPSHYLNQCWLIISKVLCHSSEDIVMRRFEDTNQ